MGPCNPKPKTLVERSNIRPQLWIFTSLMWKVIDFKPTFFHKVYFYNLTNRETFGSSFQFMKKGLSSKSIGCSRKPPSENINDISNRASFVTNQSGLRCFFCCLLERFVQSVGFGGRSLAEIAGSYPSEWRPSFLLSLTFNWRIRCYLVTNHFFSL